MITVAEISEAMARYFGTTLRGNKWMVIDGSRDKLLGSYVKLADALRYAASLQWKRDRQP